MDILGAFVAGGALCALAEALRRRLAGDAGRVVALCIALGAVLAATGAMAALIGVGDAGVIVMVVDSGEALFDSWSQLVAGDPARLLRYVRDMGAIIGFAAVVGAVRGVRRAKASPRA